MIKATITSFAGSEFKTPKEIFIWFGFKHGDKETVHVSLTFHSSFEEAKENQMNKTDKGLVLMFGVNPEFKFLISDLGNFTDFESLKISIQNKSISNITGLKLSHVSKLEIC